MKAKKRPNTEQQKADTETQNQRKTEATGHKATRQPAQKTEAEQSHKQGRGT